MFDSIPETPRPNLDASVVIVGSSLQIFKLLSALVEMHGFKALHVDDLEDYRRVEPRQPKLAMINIDESLKAGSDGLERINDLQDRQGSRVVVFSERFRQHEVQTWFGRQDGEVLCFPLSVRTLDACLQRHLVGQA